MRKHFSTTVMGIFLFSVAVSTMPTFDVAAFFQNQERVIIQEQSFQKDPIEISEVLVGDKAIRFGEKFAASELWLKETALKLTNKHSKPVTYVQINVDFPEVLHIWARQRSALSAKSLFDSAKPALKMEQFTPAGICTEETQTQMLLENGSRSLNKHV